MDWDLSTYFPSIEDTAYTDFKARLRDDIARLRKEAEALPVAGADPGTWEKFLRTYEDLLARVSHLGSYVSCLCAADAEKELHQQEEAALADLRAGYDILHNRLLLAVGALSEEGFSDLCTAPALRDLAPILRKWREEAQKRMPRELEELNSELGVNGLSAWSRLYFQLMGKMNFRYDDPEEGEKEVPMAHYTSLLSDPDRQRRRAVFDGAAKALTTHETTCAAALNAIAGTRHTLNRRRDLDNFLDPSLRQSRLSLEGLDALMGAIDKRLPFAREVFRFRSAQMGIEDPGYHDLRAPIPLEGGTTPGWAEGTRLISRSFHGAYPRLGSFFDEMTEKRWIDHSPRSGKRPGGFCSPSLYARESRIFMTYRDCLPDVLTLAHEAGHAFHSHVLGKERPLRAGYTMPLAETASTFAEKILTEGVLSDGDNPHVDKCRLLDAEIEHMLAFLLDLPVRFRFERELYRRRQDKTLSVREIRELMEETQRTVFSNSLAESGLDSGFWISKLHFYISGVQFYNYPYTFGYLLSTAFMERLRSEGTGFLRQYEEFLRLTGHCDCETAVRESIGEDIREEAFWLRQIDALQRPFETYKAMVADMRA